MGLFVIHFPPIHTTTSLCTHSSSFLSINSDIHHLESIYSSTTQPPFYLSLKLCNHSYIHLSIHLPIHELIHPPTHPSSFDTPNPPSLAHPLIHTFLHPSPIHLTVHRSIYTCIMYVYPFTKPLI